jgi:hypothetical protein
MAWTETCKASAHITAKTKLHQRPNGKKRTLTAVLKEMSKETGIPFNTLKRWYYEVEKEQFINDTNLHSIENIDDNNENKENGGDKKDIEMCKRCGKNPIHLKTTGKPYGKLSKHYGLCSSCRSKSQRKVRENKPKDGEPTISVVCPKCGHEHEIKGG